MRMRLVLSENGRLFISIREGVGKIPERSLATIDGEEYDRNFIAHTLDELIEAAACIVTDRLWAGFMTVL